MTVTNGQDRSTTSKRERGRQALDERTREKLPLSTSRLEERRTAPHQWLAISSGNLRRMTVRPEGALSAPPIGWNVRAENKPVTERKGHTVGFPVRSRQKPTGLAEGYKSVCERWSVDALGMAKLLHLEEEIGLCSLILSGHVPPLTGDLKDRMALVIGISIGLGELFDDDKDAELQWLISKRSELGNVSPLEHMLKGDLLNVKDIVDLVNNARGLR